MTANESKQAGAVLDTIFKFLLGESPLDGLWFGERKPDRGQWWWRTNLREAFNEYATAIAARDLWMERAGAALLMIPDDKLCGDLRAAKERLTEQRQALEAQLAAAIAERDSLRHALAASGARVSGLESSLDGVCKDRDRCAADRASLQQQLDAAREALRIIGRNRGTGHRSNCSSYMGSDRDCHCGWMEAKQAIEDAAHPSPASASAATKRECRWTQMDDGGHAYNTCDSRHPYHIDPGCDPWPYCHHCGRSVVLVPWDQWGDDASPPSNDGEGVKS